MLADQIIYTPVFSANQRLLLADFRACPLLAEFFVRHERILVLTGADAIPVVTQCPDKF